MNFQILFIQFKLLDDQADLKRTPSKMKTIALFTTLLGFAAAYSGDATYYDLGMTACGQVYKDTDLVAAVAPNHWAGGNPNNDPICRRSARVTDPKSGRGVTVRIKDKCMGCKPGDIDLSRAAFKQLRDFSVGRFRVNWNFE